MGNETSFLCCSSAADKYELRQARVAEAHLSAGEYGHARKPSVEKSGTSQQPTVKPAGPFTTTDPLEVAPELAPQQGLPYQFHVCGPPPPPCDDIRLRTINALKIAGSVRMDADAIDAPPDPEIASILKLVQSIFEAPAALVALFDDRRIFIRDAEGAFQRGDFPWRWSFCGWTMASKNDQIMVIPDATKDARFCNNAMVKSGPGVRFYCGTPLIASNGHRIGTLCFADVRPREFDASRYVVLNNLAELVVRHLEKDIALQLRAHDNNTLMAAYGNLRRTLDCFDHCVALLDTGTAGWRVLFVNNPCCKALGIDRESLQGSYISRLLVDEDGSMMPNDDQQLEADRGREFTCTARLCSSVVEEVDDKARDGENTAAVGHRFLLTFRPASREELDRGQIPIGVPSFIPAAPRKEPAEAEVGADGEKALQVAQQRRTDKLYFMLLEDAAKVEAERAAAKAKAAAEAKAAAAAASANASTAQSSLLSVGLSYDRDLSQPPESISGLTMGHLLGKGAYGSVYYGMWYGSPVAVKIIDEELPPGAESIAPPVEAILSKELRHPHIVATLRCARRIVGPTGSSHLVSGGTAAAVAAVRRSASAAQQPGAPGSIDTFSDDTALVSRVGSTSGGVSCVIPRSRGAAAAVGAAPAVPDGNPNSGWLQGSALPRVGCGGSSAATCVGNTNSAGTSSLAGPCSSATGGAGGTSTSTATPAGATTPSTVTEMTEAGGTVFNTSFAGSAAASANPGPGPGGASLSSVPSQATTSQAGWAIIDLGANPSGAQTGRKRSTAAQSTVGAEREFGEEGEPAAAAAVAGEAGAGASDGSTENSEAYDDFDAGRDSNMSPFLLPPGSHQTGGGGGGVSGLPGNSGPSGASERWATEEVLVRHQTWLIMEYCDRGCLQDAIDRGWLRTSPALENSAPRMDAVLATAVELASALSFLHSKDIAHGDLSAWNVMLCTSGATASVGGRNFVAKIADFGLARHLDIRTKIQTRTYGTLTHMPAETLRDGVISKATDVYSMGVLLWQLFTSSRPWAGLRHGQIIVMVVTQGARLRFPAGCPPAYEELAMACMDSDPRKRPAVENVLAVLEAIRKDLL